MLGWFAETTLVASGLAVVAALGGRVRSIGPAARHALWLVVLIKLMAPPLVCWPWAVSGWSAEGPLFAPTVAQDAPFPTRDDGPGARDPRWPARLAEPWDRAAVPHRLDSDPFFTGCGPPPGAFRTAAAAAIEAPPGDDLISPARVPIPSSRSFPMARLGRGLVAACVIVTVLLAIGQVGRIIRFRRRLRAALPPPDDLVEEAGWIGRRLGVRAPELLMVPELGTPLLWCLGPPKLLLPAQLIKTLERDRWRGILIHELAHLRRGDHWVSRLELAAGLIWWWNPLYWLTRVRLEAEAELACDAWVVQMLPKDRLTYAQALFDICSTLSAAKSPVPALGVAGSGRFLERRLTMILQDRVPCRLSPFGLALACLLALCALPSWSAARPVADDPAEQRSPAARATTVDQATIASAVDDADDNDDDADDEDDKPAAHAKAKAKAQAKAKAKADAKKAKATPKEATPDLKLDFDFSKRGKGFEITVGPDFAKKMEALGKEMEAKFGPGSDFEKKMKALGEETKEKSGPDSEFIKQLPEQAGSRVSPKAEKEPSQPKAARPGARAGRGAADVRSTARNLERERQRRIAALEAQIRKLADELKALKAGDNRDEDQKE